MMHYKPALVAFALLAASAATAAAQMQYPSQYQPYAAQQAPAAPQSWSYDPYTSGLGPCPQWHNGDSGRCHDQMAPTYGQPKYGPAPNTAWPR